MQERSSSEKNTFIEERIRELGFRMTAQRQIVLDAIKRVGEHATFDEIFNETRRAAPKLSRATIYRTLETFSRYRLIHGNEIAGGKVYEIVAANPHHHLICHNCWTDEKIKGDELDGFGEKMNLDHGFLVLSEHMIFMGLCRECRSAKGDSLGRFAVHPKFQTSAQKEEQ